MLTRHTGTAKPMYSTTTPFSRPTFPVTTAIYLQPCVTLNFDLLTSKLIVSRPCPLTTCANLHQIGSIIFKILPGLAIKQVKNTLPWSASLRVKYFYLC